MSVVAIVLAAGESRRFGRNKMRLDVDGQPAWLKSFLAFDRHPEVLGTGLVVSRDLHDEVKREAPSAAFIVLGGETRTESARAGLAALDKSCDIVLIHDGARPYVTPQVISRVIQGVMDHGAAYPAIPVTDTVRLVASGGLLSIDRDQLHVAQTPQGASRELFARAYSNPEEEYTDDIAAVLAIGEAAMPVEGEVSNLKITYPGDVQRMTARQETRTGFGYDIHAFSSDPDRELWLGGVRFGPDERGLTGHSDADAVLHAVVDALLGAAGLGDIGEAYPDTAQEWKDAPSSLFLRGSVQKVVELGWRISNIDVTVIAEVPKIGPRRDEMRRSIAELCGIESERVNVKATTSEKLGPIGHGEGIAAMAVATLERS